MTEIKMYESEWMDNFRFRIRNVSLNEGPVHHNQMKRFP